MNKELNKKISFSELTQQEQNNINENIMMKNNISSKNNIYTYTICIYIYIHSILIYI